jgi:hypothetical protein
MKRHGGSSWEKQDRNTGGATFISAEQMTRKLSATNDVDDGVSKNERK